MEVWMNLYTMAGVFFEGVLKINTFWGVRILGGDERIQVYMGHFETFPLKIVHWTNAAYIKKPVKNKHEPFLVIYLGGGLIELHHGFPEFQTS